MKHSQQSHVYVAQFKIYREWSEPVVFSKQPTAADLKQAFLGLKPYFHNDFEFSEPTEDGLSVVKTHKGTKPLGLHAQIKKACYFD